MDYGYHDTQVRRGKLIQAHIADIHFGAFDPKTQYEILVEQCLSKLYELPKLDVIALDGDLFDHKVMSNSDTTMYASLFVDNVVNLARSKGATLIILHGTFSHDYDQLKIFYHYMYDKTVDVRIITSIKFEYIKGAKVLCIPELYGVNESVYRHFFFESGWYDEAFIHGTFKGSVYGDNVGQGRLLTPEDFVYCTGFAVSGHVHKGGCFNGFFYYCGCPYRWKFGEEEDKGFLLIMHDLDTQMHYVDFQKIESFRYDTIYIDDLIHQDPKKMIDYINTLRVEKGIDFIKVRFRVAVPGYAQTVINNYYRNNGTTFVEFMNLEEVEKQKKTEQLALDSKYDYLIDNTMSDMERFVRFVNESEGCEFISVQKLTEILGELL